MEGGCAYTPVPPGLPHGVPFDPGCVGCVALATAAEAALMTPNPNGNLNRIDYSIKADFQMEPYLGTLHQGPLRTNLALWHVS